MQKAPRRNWAILQNLRTQRGSDACSFGNGYQTRFIRDHLEPAETYRLCATNLEIGEFLPSIPESLTQDSTKSETVSGSRSNA